MIIFLFFTTWLLVFGSLVFFSGLSFWFIPLWLFVGYLSGFLFVVLSFVVLHPLVYFTKPTRKFKHFYVRNLADFLRLFVLWVHITEIVDKDNIPKDKNFVVVGNHKSGLDPVVVQSLIRRPIAFVGKDSLFKIPIVKGWLKGVGSLSINRKNDREAFTEIKRGINLINEGLSMGLFPEGTRQGGSVLEMGEFKVGAFKLATKSKVPILPMALIGTEQYKHNRFRRRTNVKVVVGKPIEYEEYQKLTSNELSEKVYNIINVLIKSNI